MKVLIAPLNWGVGHAARCIPVIRQLLSEGKEVHIASDGVALSLLKSYFPKVTFHELNDLNITYTKSVPLYLKFPVIAWRLIKGYRHDRRKVELLQARENFDIIISDSRFGAYSKKAKSYIIIHQLRLSNFGGKPTEWIAQQIIKRLLKPFETCLIPDHEGTNNLTGAISRPIDGIPYLYTKPLSRFPIDGVELPLPRYNILVIVSGPEPQRTKFENIILKLAASSSKNIMLFRGTKSAPEINTVPNIKVFDFAGDSMFQSLVHNCDLIITRAGYSTIMDLYALKKGAVLVPTPNQPEQEYLAKWLNGKFGFMRCKQSSKHLKKFF